MSARRWWLAAVVIAALAGGGYYYVAASGRARAAQQGPRARAVGLGVILAIRTLERDSDTRLSRDQIGKVLPFVKALADRGVMSALAADEHLRNGLHVCRGAVTRREVAQARGYEYVEPLAATVPVG